jgi:hypothetical protein
MEKKATKGAEMSTAVATAVTGEIGQQRMALFAELDARAREIEEQQKSTWVELADLCCTIRDSELWREGGYTSFGAWLQSACPTSRSYAYMAIGIREELREISEAELKQIPLGNADILKHTPKQHRGKVLEAAKAQPPREFIGTVIHEAPDSHLEHKHCHKFRIDSSQSKVLVDAFAMWRALNDDPDAPREAALEGIIADWMQEHQRQYEWKLQNK